MTTKRSSLILTTVFAILAAGCSSGSGDTTQAPATTSPTTTTSTSTTTTTTTTTLPPGLQPQVLEYALEPGALWEHTVATEAILDLRFVDVDAEGMTVEDLGDDAEMAFSMSAEGRRRTLILNTDESGVYEAITDERLDEGTLIMASGSTETKETMTSDDLTYLGGPFPPAVIDVTGTPTAVMAGAPAPRRVEADLDGVMASLGPVFTSEPVDVGDSWSFAATSELLGEAAGEATITDEIEYGDDDWAFVIEFEAEYPDLPITTTSADLSAGSAAGGQELLAMLAGIGETTADIDIEYRSSLTSGTVTFVPSIGIPAKLETESYEHFTLRMYEDDYSMTVEVELTATSTVVFVDSKEATSYERESVLSGYEADPFLLADAALLPMGAYYVGDPDWDVFDSVVEVLETTPSYFVAGMSAVGFSEDLDAWVDVFALTNSGGYRGDPYLADFLIYLWTEKEGRAVSVAGTTAYRTTVDGTEWLVWNSDTHTFVVVGPRSASVSALEVLIDAQSPYLWQQGDCLEFSDYDHALPYSPFGEFGLRHCSHDHEYEVLYSEILPEGPGDSYPDDLLDRTRRACGEQFIDHVGAFPLDSNVDVVTYLPDPDEWDRGARYVACLIYLEGADGPTTLDSRFDTDTAETFTFEPGDCLAGTFRVPCTDPHSVEVIAVDEYDAPADAEYPDFSDLMDELLEVCSAEFDEYGATEGELELDSSVYSDMSLAWDAGERTYLCVAAALDEDGWAVDIIGSLHGDWEIAPEQFDA